MADLAPVLLNGNRYRVRYPIARELIQRQTAPIRTTGGFLRTNDPKMEAYVFNSWRRGLGTRYVRPGHPEDREGFWHTNCLTLWPNHISFPISSTNATLPTHNSVAYSIVASAIFNGRLWALMRPPEEGAFGIASVIARNLSGATWGGGGDVLTEAAATEKIMGFDMIVAEAKLYAIGAIGGGFLLRYSSDGVTWTAPATTAPPTGGLFTSATTMINDQAYGARLAYDGVNVVLAIHDQVGGEIEVYKSTNGGDTWASVLTRNIQSSGGPTGLKAYLHTDGTIVVYLAAAEGLYLIDIPTSGTINAEQLMVFNGNARNGMRMETHQGSLYIPIDNGNDAPFGMKKLTVVGDQRTIEDVGLDITQGVPDTLLGAVRWMRSQGPFLFASVGGAAASRNAYILAITGAKGDGWQCVQQHGTANDPMPWLDFNGADLILQLGGETAAGATDPGDARRDVNLLIPTAGTSGVHTFAGGPFDLELPDFGGDAPEEPGAFFAAAIEGLSLADGAEFIDVEYGLNGATPSAPATDVRLDDTNRRQSLGTSSRGLSARTIRINLELNAGANLSPRLRQFTLLFRKRPARLERYLMEIDIMATSAEEGQGQQRGYNVILNELNTIFDSQIAVPFTPDADTGEIQVEVTDYRFGDWTTAPPQSRDTAHREGRVSVVLEQVA